MSIILFNIYKLVTFYGNNQAMVMEYYENGSASDYLKSNPDGDRKRLVCPLPI